MSFPTYDVLAATRNYLYYASLEEQLRTRAPELAERIERPDVAPFYIKVALDARTSVMLAITKIGRSGAWLLVDPKYPAWPRVWALNTPSEILVEAVRSRALAWIAGTPEQSPWRWDEPEESPLTQLADLLSAQGLVPQSVVAKNRSHVIEADTSDGRTVLTPGEIQGDFLLLRTDQLDVRVALKAGLGWFIDVRSSEAGFWRRVDIARHLTGGTSATPGMASAAITLEALSDLVASVATDLQAEVLESGALHPELLPPLPVLGMPHDYLSSEWPENIAEQFRAMGFADVEADLSGSPVGSPTHHFVWWGRPKPPGLSDLQRLNGVAAAEEKKLVLITSLAVSRSAAQFADRARAFVFSLDSRSGCLHGTSALAEEAELPGWQDWIMMRHRLAQSIRGIDSGSVWGSPS